ncbi:MAG: hypothetical protein M3247_00500 [Thermoproteota archaeon]|nr:hypothetical protein [Thermoproteota archaeon]
MKQQLFGEFCDQLIKLNSSIRFVGIADDTGSLLSISEREGLKPLLNYNETEQYAITAMTRQYTRLRWRHTLGKIDYTCSVYEKLIRANIPITDAKNRLEFVVLLTFDMGTDNFHQLMVKKIIPFIRKNKGKIQREVKKNQ